MNATETKVYGPVNLSVAALSVLAAASHQGEGGESTTRQVLDWYCSHDGPDAVNRVMRGYDGWPVEPGVEGSIHTELSKLVDEWGDDYPTDRLFELNGTGLKTHMRADELSIGQKFWTGEDGGSGTKKSFRRIENPFGPNVVDGKIAARVTSSYDGTRGDTVQIAADQIVRPLNQPVEADDNWVGGPIDTPEELAESKRRWDDYRAASDAISQRVDEYVKSQGAEKVYVHYSVYEKDDRDVPVDNLDRVAVEGKVVFKQVAESDSFYGGDEGNSDYESPVLENPTWLELCYHFNTMMQTVGDYHHCFFEGVYPAKEEQGGVPVYRFGSGS